MTSPRWRLDVVDEIGSTSDEVATRARAGEPAGLALLARRQTAARGSRGRRWSEPPSGNLAMTVLRRPDGDHARVSTDTVFVAAVAVHDALSPLLGPGERLGLKWPNDLLVAREGSGLPAMSGKVGGILVEAEFDPSGRAAAVTIGIGVNLCAAPDGVAGAVALLPPPREAPAPEMVAWRVLDALGQWEDIAALDGFGAIRAAWLARAHPSGTSLTVTKPGGGPRTGRFVGLDERGALLLEVDGAVEAVATGAVLLGDRTGAPACCS